MNKEDGYFCDMQDKTIYPVCVKNKAGEEVCFDTEQNDLGKLPNFDVYYASA